MAPRFTPEEIARSYETESGLPDDFDLWVEKAYFGTRQEYMEGQVPLLIWEGNSPDVDLENPIIWPVGTGWEVREQGELAVHHSDEERKRAGKPLRVFIKASLYARLIERCRELGISEVLRKKGSTREASIWKGLGFHLKREEIVYGSGILVEKGGKTEHLMPVAFLGTIEQRPMVPTVAPATASAAAPVATAPAAAPTAAPLVERLTKIAKLLERTEFQKQALNMAEVAKDPALLTSILDDGAIGFWAKARAS